MVKEVVRRIGRPGVDITDLNMSGLISALMSKRIEMMVNPFGITADRALRADAQDFGYAPDSPYYGQSAAAVQQATIPRPLRGP